MSTDAGTFQLLLANMRKEFINELPERCTKLERLILKLENDPGNREIFNELYRGVHSLKGSGGTHGLSIITTICHQLESRLADGDVRHCFDKDFTTGALFYVDLLFSVITEAKQDKPDYSTIEHDLDAHRYTELQTRKAGLIAESSSAMAGFYQKALAGLPLQLTVVDNGLTALERLLHEPFDFIIAGRELKELNGIAMVTALRTSLTRNHKIPAFLVTSRHGSIPEYAGFTAVIARDNKQAANLVAAVKTLLR